MAKIKKFTFGENNWNADASQAVAFFNSLNCPLIETELVSEYDYTVTFDGVVTLKSYGYGNPGAKFTVIVDGVETQIMTSHGAYGSKTFIVLFSEKFVYVIYRGISYQNEAFDFIYEEIDEGKLYGFSTGTSGNLSSIILQDIESETMYAKTNPLNYQVPANTLDYMEGDPVFDIYNNRTSQSKQLDDPNFLACTTVPAKQIISFNGQDYYSLSPNSIVEVEIVT